MDAVEEVLDSCHALMDHGVDRYQRPSRCPGQGARRARRASARSTRSASSTTSGARCRAAAQSATPRQARRFPAEPRGEHPVLHREERAAARAVAARDRAHRAQDRAVLLSAAPDPGDERRLGDVLALHAAQPPVRRSGCVDRRLHDRVPAQSHTNVVYAAAASTSRGYSGINPYALGFAMMQRHPPHLRAARPTRTAHWFPRSRRHATGASRWTSRCATSRTRSFIAQYLSPRLIRDFRLFAVADHDGKAELEVDSIHDDQGYRRVRRMLAEQYKRENMLPDIQVARYERDGDRSLTLRNQIFRGRPLAEDEANEVLRHLGRLWGFPCGSRLSMPKVGSTAIASGVPEPWSGLSFA